MMTSQNLAFVLDEVVSGIAYEAFYEDQFMMPLLYDVRTSERKRERLASLAGLTLYSQKTNGAEPASDNVIQEFEKDFIHVSYGKKVSIERELVDDEEWGLLVDVGQQIGMLAAQTMEVTAAAAWSDFFTGATYKAEDNLSVCNSAHLNVDAGNSQSNTGTSDLDFAGIKAARIAMRKFTNYRGDKMSVHPKLLVVPTDLEEVAWEMIRSTGKPDTANNNANMYNGMFDLVVWDFLTDTNAWFMVDPRLMKLNLIWFQRIALEVFGDGNLFTGTRNIGGYYRAALGVRDWRWIYGNNPS